MSRTNRIIALSFLGLLFCFLMACVPPSEVNDLDIKVDYSLKEHQTIGDLQDRRETVGLIEKLSSPFVTERYLAILGLASTQDSIAVDSLIRVMNVDLSMDNRAAAAYALGQIGSSTITPWLVRSFATQDTAMFNTSVHANILEAIGKTGSIVELEQIANVSTYLPEDDWLIWGQMSAIYRFGVRGIFHPKATSTVVDKLKDAQYPVRARRIAASYLQRHASLDLKEYLSTLRAVFTSESDVFVRAGLASALGRHFDVELDTEGLKNEKDYRVKVNALRGMRDVVPPSLMDTILLFLKDENVHVRHTAAELLAFVSTPNRINELLELARSISEPTLKANLLGAALGSTPIGFVNTSNVITAEIVSSLKTTNNIYHRAQFIKALGNGPDNFNELKSLLLTSNEPIIRTTIISAIGQILDKNVFGPGPRATISANALRKAIILEMINILNGNDPGAIAVACSVIKHKNLNAKEYLELKPAIRQAVKKLSLPKESETKYELESTIAFLNDSVATPQAPVYNHPIDWSIMAGINDSSRVYINTTKGQIVAKLFVNYSPGSISNFMRLAQDNYYDGKVVHRVVPNFVVQTGCDRGDGYGSLDYSIRSELGPIHYDDEGYIGMASAGKDTEGTQWFITHSPTPHLDGRYTIFAKVVEGMNVVHTITVGDLVQDIRILKN